MPADDAADKFAAAATAASAGAALKDSGTNVPKPVIKTVWFDDEKNNPNDGIPKSGKLNKNKSSKGYVTGDNIGKGHKVKATQKDVDSGKIITWNGTVVSGPDSVPGVAAPFWTINLGKSEILKAEKSDPITTETVTVTVTNPGPPPAASDPEPAMPPPDVVP